MPDTEPRVRAGQIGSWPGTDFAVAQRIAFAELPDLPSLMELPDRGSGAGMVGRALAMLSGINVDLQPSGWRIAPGESGDLRTARALLRDDLDRFEEAAQGYHGPAKVAATGPWTLAATVEGQRGEKLLGDRGACKELAESLAEGIAELAAELGRRLPDLHLLWQLDEPLVGSVIGGQVPTASGLNRFRSIDTPELITELDRVITATDGPVWLHDCGADAPWHILVQSAASGFAVDASLVGAAGWDALGPALEGGRSVALGVVRPGGSVPAADDLVRTVLRWWESLGLSDDVVERVWITPSCGLAARTEAEAIGILRVLHRGAELITEQLAAG